MNFQLTPEQSLKLGFWLDEQRKELAKHQWQIPEIRKLMLDESTPYLGAIDGGVTYEFTPTSLGVATTVHFCRGTVFESKIDLTDYDEW